jgi:hypothetical protein
MPSEKSVAQKLLVKAGRKVLILKPPQAYANLLGELPPGAILLSGFSEPADIIQVFVESRIELEEWLPRLKEHIRPDGMIWVTYHKGTSKVKTDIHRDSINTYAHTLGLEGVAMISIDEDWSALRLKVI